MSSTVELVQVSKSYPLWHHLGSGLKSLLLHPGQLKALIRQHQHAALENVSFRIRRGESVALIGRNGAGKSTLLGLIAGVLSPTTGEVKVCGRVASMLELGAGFHPELTGRENIALNATLLGLRWEEVKRAMPAIIDFAELGRFIDEPVRVYSSGMLARLGFAVMTQISPDILLVDEVLAVGDAAFRQRCYEVLKRFRAQGVTLLFVSHNPKDIQQFCDRVLWFENHQMIADGSPNDILPLYQDAMQQEASKK
ncbi:UNVERIFIED_ORG: lipopolysaccharide transport system ATP-binding protein [Lelliottia amnigena]|jgi:lipopolysaccharide transport system ATP-binding protein|nr:lipopolysaccharide transport system ATP-binding protein [Lelliottia amnigena]